MTDADDVQRYLLTLAGMVMEDASAQLLDDRADRPVGARLTALQRASRELVSLAGTTALVARFTSLERED